MKLFPRIIGIMVALPILLGASPQWDAQPWLSDLAQIRAAIDQGYPNRDWLTEEREVSLDRWFERAATDIRTSNNDSDARSALDTLIKRFKDGHLSLDWRQSQSTQQVEGTSQNLLPMSILRFCAVRGFDSGQVSAGTAVEIPGYTSLPSSTFSIGQVDLGNEKLGVLRIGVFSAFGYPKLCEEAVAITKIPIDAPCNESCEDKLLTEAYALMTRDLMASLERLKASRSNVLLIDLTRNGGGTDWVEAAARIVSPVTVQSPQIRVIRSQAWEDRWRSLASKLRTSAEQGLQAERASILDLATKADSIASGLAQCSSSSCSRLAFSGYSSGLLPAASRNDFAEKSWGAEVFGPSQFPYRDHAWTGPLIVLVDGETWSAAEQFSALIRDNNAGVVMGERTGGAGCGTIYEHEAVVLTFSKARLSMPNCARFRRDGTNEVSGIIPDIPTGLRWNDGKKLAGRTTLERLPEAIAKAREMKQRNRNQRSN